MMGGSVYGFMRINPLCARREEVKNYMFPTTFHQLADWEMIQYVKSLSAEETFGGQERIC